MTDAPPGRVHVPDAAPPPPGMSPALRDATRTLATTLFRRDEGAPPEARVAWLCDDLDDFLGRAGGRARWMFWLCVTAVTWLAPLHVGRAARLSSLDDEARARALEAMERGPFALALFGAKALLCFVWYEHPEVARSAGYDGRCMDVDARRRLPTVSA